MPPGFGWHFLFIGNVMPNLFQHPSSKVRSEQANCPVGSWNKFRM